jgi:integrase
VLAPGEGSIYPAKDGRWGGSVHIGYEDGKRIRKHVMGRTRNEVKDKLGVLMRAHEEKRPIPDQRAKLGPFLRRWLDEVAEPTLRPWTYRSYDAILKIHLVPGRSAPPSAGWPAATWPSWSTCRAGRSAR